MIWQEHSGQSQRAGGAKSLLAENHQAEEGARAFTHYILCPPETCPTQPFSPDRQPSQGNPLWRPDVTRASISRQVRGRGRLGLEPTLGDSVRGKGYAASDRVPLSLGPVPDRACTVRGLSRRWPQKAAMRLRSDCTTPVSRKRGNPSKART